MVSFNASQREAISILDGGALILAGAGSGKTTVITHRMFNLMDHGVSGRNILALTFTNKAAREMKERMTKLYSRPVARLNIMTFHSLAVYILRRYASFVGVKGQFNIYNDYDQKKLYGEIFKEISLDDESMNLDKIMTRIAREKNNYVAPEKMRVENEEDYEIQRVYKLYQERMLSYGALSFDDLLFYTMKLFEESPSVLEECRSLFRFVMVDEYQDTNRIQYLVTKALSIGHGNLFVVGDDDQSIYGWRGADIRNILNFKEDFPNAKIIKLEENYRSTNHILRAANSLIGNNVERHSKNLYSRFEDGKRVLTFESSSPREEAKRLAEDILKKRLLYSCEFKNFAVLFRTHHQAKIVEEVFKEEMVPFISANEFDLYERKEVRDVISYLKLLNNPNDDLSFLRIVNYPKRGVGPKVLGDLTKFSSAMNKSIVSCIEDFMESQSLNVRVRSGLSSLFNLLNRYQEKLNGKEMLATYLEFLKELEFEENLFIEEDDPEKAERRIYFLEQFQEVLEKYVKSKSDPKLSDFLQRLAIFLQSKDKEDSFSEDGVHLLTIHGAKGLEFDYVYILGMEEGSLPFQKEGEEMNLNEERRLAYVAITRAKKELTLSLSVSKRRDGIEILSEPSRFLDEIDDSVILRNYGRYLTKKGFEEEREDDKFSGDIGEATFDKMKGLFDEKS